MWARLGGKQSSSPRDVSQASGHSLGWLPRGPEPQKWVLVVAVPLNYMAGGIAGDHEAFEDTDRKLQDVVRLELQWAFFFGSASS